MADDSEWVQVDPRYSTVPGIDPTVEWAVSEKAGLEYFFPSPGLTWMPILVEFQKGKELSSADFESGKHFAEGDDLSMWSRAVRVPRVHTMSALVNDPVQFCTALVTRDFFELVWANDKVKANYVEYVARVTLGLPLDDDSLPLKSGSSK